MKLSKAFEGYKISKLAEGYSPDTINRYKYCFRIFARLKGDMDLEDITHKDLTEFFYWLRTEYTPTRRNGDTSPLKSSSLYAFWKAIRSLFNWAELELEIDRPDTNLKAPKYSHRDIAPYTQEEIQRLIKACEYSLETPKGYRLKRPTFDRDKAIVLTLLDTGLRVSECARLKIRDVKLENGEMNIEPYGSSQKTKGRIVYIGALTRKAIWKYLAGRDVISNIEPLFVSIQYNAMNRNSIRSVLRRIGERAGVENVHAHRFRHTFAIQFLRNGGNVFTLQRLLGHSTLDMVRNYLAIAQADAEAAHRTASPVDRWRL